MLEVTLKLLMVFLLLFVTAVPVAQGQTLRVLYSFTGGADGGIPPAGVRFDAAGNLYGSTVSGNGTLFSLSRAGQGWTFRTLHRFLGGNDGAYPYGQLTVGPDGNVYGTTLGGGPGGAGTVFKLRPLSRACALAGCPFSKTLVYGFRLGEWGAPYAGVIFDQAGNIYGTTIGDGNNCGTNRCGSVYELMPASGLWTWRLMYAFSGPDGAHPSRDLRLVFDTAGNLYGQTSSGGNYDCGTVFELSPSANGWTEKVLYSFQNAADGCTPAGGVVLDATGNLYGSTSGGAAGGTIFQLARAGDAWSYHLLHTFNHSSGPETGLTMDAEGNLYGTAANGGSNCSLGGNGCGSVFKLSPGPGGWTYTSLHDFLGFDGAFPYSDVTFDTAGNVYGTTAYGGSYGYGVVWEIAP